MKGFNTTIYGNELEHGACHVGRKCIRRCKNPDHVGVSSAASVVDPCHAGECWPSD